MDDSIPPFSFGMISFPTDRGIQKIKFKQVILKISKEELKISLDFILG